jgi:rhomboid family GlyGly-CTERM serine protease
MPYELFPRKLLWLFGGVVVLSALLQLLNTSSLFQDSFSYSRDAVLDYRFIWQWLTSSLVHVGWMHWLLNILNLAAVIFLFQEAWTVPRFVLLFAASSLSIVVGLYVFSPDVAQCVGMSGVLYGLVIYGALRTFARQKFLSGVALLYVTGKLFADKTINHYMGVDLLLGNISVAVDAHWYGAIMGCVFAMFVPDFLLKRSTHNGKN